VRGGVLAGEEELEPIEEAEFDEHEFRGEDLCGFEPSECQDRDLLLRTDLKWVSSACTGYLM
jgi:hypothetical protein